MREQTDSGQGFPLPLTYTRHKPMQKDTLLFKKKILIHNQKEGHNLQLSSILEALWSNYFKKILAAAHLERNELLLSIFKSNQINFTSHYKHTYIKLTSKISIKLFISHDNVFFFTLFYWRSPKNKNVIIIYHIYIKKT